MKRDAILSHDKKEGSQHFPKIAYAKTSSYFGKRKPAMEQGLCSNELPVNVSDLECIRESRALRFTFEPTLEPSPKREKAAKGLTVKELSHKHSVFPLKASSRKALYDHSSVKVSSDHYPLPEPWVSKYRPKCSTDIVGNRQVIATLRKWLKEYSNAEKVNKTLQLKSSTSRKQKKSVLICGPPGIGKTAATSIISSELGYSSLWVNAGDVKKPDCDVKLGINGKNSNMVKEFLTNQMLTKGKAVLIFDDVHVDQTGLMDLSNCAIPVIYICNDVYKNGLQKLKSCCNELKFRRPMRHEILKRLTFIMEKEGMHFDVRWLEGLIEGVQFDIRQAINQLQYICIGVQGQPAYMKVGHSIRDIWLSPFSTTERLLFSPGDWCTLETRIDLVMQDANLIPLLIQENYLGVLQMAHRMQQTMDLVSRCADAICLGDITNSVMHRKQIWDFLPLVCVNSALACPSSLQESRETFAQGISYSLRFPAWSKNNSLMEKNKSLLTNILSKSRFSLFLARQTFLLDFYPFAHQIDTKLLKNGKYWRETKDAYACDLKEKDWDDLVRIVNIGNIQKGYSREANKAVLQH